MRDGGVGSTCEHLMGECLSKRVYAPYDQLVVIPDPYGGVDSRGLDRVSYGPVPNVTDITFR